MLSNLRQDIFFIISNANLIDYMVYGWILLCFLFLLLLGIYCAIKWWWQVGFLVVLFDFVALFIGVYFANFTLSNYVRATYVTPLHTKQLEYSDNLMVDFNITNLSKNSFQICKVDLKFYASSDKDIKNFINSLNPFVTKTIIINEPLHPKQSKEVSSIVKNFAFINYNTKIKTECFE